MNSENDDGTISWSTLLREASDQVGANDARWIVCEVTGVELGELHVALDELATVRGVARLDAMVKRRLDGEPLQYVLGRWGFRTLDLMVDHRVLIPRPETEMVAGLAIDEVQARTAGGSGEVLVADLGTGSGAIGLSIAAECRSVRVMATDASADALAVATANLAGLGRTGTQVSLHLGHWFAALPPSAEGTVDVIVSNPPYVTDGEELPPVVDEWEPSSALRAGPDGLDDLRSIVDESPRWLNANGVMVLEMAPGQTAVVAQWCRAVGYDTEVRQDLAGRDRAVVARRGERR